MALSEEEVSTGVRWIWDLMRSCAAAMEVRVRGREHEWSVIVSGYKLGQCCVGCASRASGCIR